MPVNFLEQMSQAPGMLSRNNSPWRSCITVITENDFIEAMCCYLEHRGYAILQALTTRQTGIDIVARHKESGLRVHIEAKGGTSSKPGSKRYGLPFAASQVRDHVSCAFYKAAQLLEDECSVAIAVPATELHKKRLDDIRHAIERLGIVAFIIDDDGAVSTYIGRLRTRPLEPGSGEPKR